MRRSFLALLGLVPATLSAQLVGSYQPVYTQPTRLRELQAQHDTVVPRIGAFGLPLPAAARFGWERVQQDSAYAFDAARTLWMDYYCLFGDSLCADWAMIRSPRAVRNRTEALVPWNQVTVQSSVRPIAQARPEWSPSAAWASTPQSAPATQPAATVSELPPKPEALRIVVRSGDNFGVLQRRYPGVTLKELYAANKGSDRIYPGQVLKIPR
ncbi:MAG: LysM peptidoglycan-binding domain-containing protein [Schleiferiaceae bacterium]